MRSAWHTQNREQRRQCPIHPVAEPLRHRVEAPLIPPGSRTPPQHEWVLDLSPAGSLRTPTSKNSPSGASAESHRSEETQYMMRNGKEQTRFKESSPEHLQMVADAKIEEAGGSSLVTGTVSVPEPSTQPPRITKRGKNRRRKSRQAVADSIERWAGRLRLLKGTNSHLRMTANVIPEH